MAVVAFSIHRAMAMSRLVGRAPTGLFFFLLPRRPSSTQLLDYLLTSASLRLCPKRYQVAS